METEWNNRHLEDRRTNSRKEFFEYFDEVKNVSPEDLVKELGLRNNWRAEIWDKPEEFIKFLESQDWLISNSEYNSAVKTPESIERHYNDIDKLIWIYLHNNAKDRNSFEVTMHDMTNEQTNKAKQIEALRRAVVVVGEYLSNRQVKANIGTQAINPLTGEYKFIVLESPID